MPMRIFTRSFLSDKISFPNFFLFNLYFKKEVGCTPHQYQTGGKQGRNGGMIYENTK